MNSATHSADEKKKDGIARRIVKKLVSIIRQKDTPQRIALGAALGVFIGFLPTVGVQMAIVTVLAIALRGNIKAALATTWISNPITFVPMYFGYYKLGLIFFPQRAIGWERFSGIITEAADWNWSEIGKSVQRFLDLGADILIPMWTGSTILAVILGVATYFFTRWAIVKYRTRKARKKASKA